MADNKVLIELQVVQKGDSLSIIQKDTDKLAKSQNKLDKNQKNVGKSSEQVIKGQKGIHQANLSSSKGFSKMNQMLSGGGGSSSLVAAYATLAANVFAATAAFNAFRGAAAFEQLAEGFTFMANQAGRTMDLVVERLKEVSGEALSTEQALQGASLAISAGFSTDDLEKLTKVAKGASLALGRNLSDAFDRLTRGAIKLEPEILDELGIMVRLDDATEAYAATIGKTANELTQFQRQTAFINAINEQGIEKYGELADAVDVNPYDKLAASFGDLTKVGLGLLNVVLIPFANLFAGSNAAMIGGLIVFGSTIVTTMIPALGNMAKNAAEAAIGAQKLATASVEAIDTQISGNMAILNSNEKQSKTVKKLIKTVQEGGDVEKQAKTTKINLTKQLQTAQTQQAAAKLSKDPVLMAAAEARVSQVKREIASTIVLGTVDTVRLATKLEAEAAILAATQSRIIAEGTATIGQVGAIAGFKVATAAIREYTAATVAATVATTGFSGVIARVGMFAGIAAVAVRLLGTAFIGFLLTAGQALLVIGLLVAAAVAVAKHFIVQSTATKTLGKVTETLNEKFTQLNTTINNMGKSASAGDTRIRQLKMSAGILLEVAGGIEAINKEAEAASKLKIEGLAGIDFGPRKAARLQGADALDVFDKAKGKEASDAIKEESFSALQEAVQEIANDTSLASKQLRDQLVKEMDAAFGAGAVEKEGGFAAFVKSLKPKDFDNTANAIQNASTKTTDWSTSLTNLKKGLTESEQVFSKFFAGISQTTPFDGLVKTFESLSTEIENLADQPKALAKTFEGMGAQMKKFRQRTFDKDGKLLSEESIEDFMKRVPVLGAAFKRIQVGTRTLQVDLKKLNVESKALKDLAENTGMGKRAFLESQNAIVEKQKELNKLEIDELEGIVKPSQEVLDKIVKLKTDQLQLEQKIKGESEIALKVLKTKLDIELKVLNLKRTAAKLAEKDAQSEARIQQLRKFGNTNINPAALQRSKVKDAKAATAFAIEEARINTERLNNTTLMQDAINEKKRKDNTIDFALYEANHIALGETLKLEQAIIDAKLAGIKQEERATIAQGMGSGDMMTIAETINLMEDDTVGLAEASLLANSALQPLVASFKELGPEGMAIANAMEHMMTFTHGIATMAEQIDILTASINKLGGLPDVMTNMGITSENFASAIVGAQMLGNALNALGAAMAASSANRVAIVDREIAAEKKLRGNSKEGQAKIEALEKRKTQIQKKAFETDKKMKIASTLIATATSAAIAFAVFTAMAGPVVGAAMAGAIIAMGAKQISLISGLTFDGGGAGNLGGPPQSIGIGSRGNSVDVSQGVTGGETGYLRGEQGIGSNANTFKPGGAAGMRNGYQSGGEILVGEQGPEVIRAPAGSSVIPNEGMSGGVTNANFTINAVDAAGVEDVLIAQRGNIINMIREAAHEHGEEFIEAVQTNVYAGGDT